MQPTCEGWEITLLTLAVVWIVLMFLSFGIPGLLYLVLKNASKRPWRLKIDRRYSPSVSIIVPTYNEASVIKHKIENLAKLEYPKELKQIIVVDSNSTDGTIESVEAFAIQHQDITIETLVQSQRKGKTAALNYALKSCRGDVIIVSDADCFWPSDILRRTLPYLADTQISAVSGPKILLNPDQSWVTRTEDSYLKSVNLMKLGESKIDSTLLFEGGFSAYKKSVLHSFDPYNTGSDDCGTIIHLTECGSRAIMVPDAEFFTTFPITYKGKISIKARRTTQLARVFATYLKLLLRNRIKSSRGVVLRNIFMYLLNPLIFLMFLIATGYLLLSIPYIVLILFVFLIPKIGSLIFEIVQSNLLLFLGFLALIGNKRIVFWSKPEDRAHLTEKMLLERALI